VRRDRVVRLYDQSASGRPSALITNYVTVEHLWTGLRNEVESMAAYKTEQIGLGRGSDARRIHAVVHTDAYFDVLGVAPALGVLPRAGHPEPGDTVVIAYGLWQRLFGGSPDVLGRTLQFGRRSYTVIGVAPRGFQGIDVQPVDVWLPIESRAPDSGLRDDWKSSTGYHALAVIARLRADVDRARAAVHASAVYNARPSPEWVKARQPSYSIVFGELPPARMPGGTGEVRTIEWIGAVSGLVLLISCGNVGNLLLVRGLRRTREFSLKASLGATRGRLIREVLIEAGLLSFAAGTVALALVTSGGVLVKRLVLSPVLVSTAPVDVRLIALAAAVTIAASFLVGAVPALRLTSDRMLNPAQGAQAGARSHLLDAFVALQVALSLPLVVGASLLSLSLWHARQVNFGIETSNVVVVSMNPEEVGTPAETHAAHRRIQQHLQRLPQVRSVSLVQAVPMVVVLAYDLSISGRQAEGVLPYVNGVDASYFELMGHGIVEGRPFTPAENVAGGRPVTLVNSAMARTFWPGESPLGRCIRIGGADKPCAEVIGVVADAAPFPEFAVRTEPMYYVPIEQYGHLYDGRALLVRTQDAPEAAIALIRAEAQRTGSSLPYIDVWAFDDLFQPALKPLRMGALVFVAFGILALVIAGVGLAAVTAYTVARRTKEIGIRLVLGANPDTLVRQIVCRSLLAVTAGLAGGSLVGFAGGRLLRSQLIGVAAEDVRVYAAAAGLLLAVSLIAAYVPARRARAVEPAAALRTE
jgi:predicted permease